MKNSKTCPKCGGEHIAIVPGDEMPPHNGVRVPAGILGSAHMDILVCCTCGYSQLWMPEDELSGIEKRYQLL